MTLTGLGLLTPGTPTALLVGGVAASNVVVVDDNTLTFDTPAGAGGFATVHLTNANGSAAHTAAYSFQGPFFEANFNNLELDPNLSYSSNMEPRSGGLRTRSPSSVILGTTLQADYASRTFVFEGDVSWGSPALATKAYFGIGRGTGSPGEPTNAVYLRMSITSPRDVDLIVDGDAGTVLKIGTFPAGGRHRFRLERDAAGLLTFSVDYNVSGTFSADLTRQIAGPGFLWSGESKLFFGSTGDIVFFDTLNVRAP